ncbi:hypothetical protein QBC33DRAFT_344440 [Phialemonium atrogriseum]|uniref:Uncharacterized protein n=1 Tax=Phialemonium atrogriseum TaxID=1093897 RepID=A0AAJ0C2V3_9PEZI|nr:uncharacterized protein QBC33DRAFT_344440 [Phialemonium atrogriseum]KAK1769145.1 hypothetical protein QBC33DRAFT_344440 [Phialemonium atrogriseum]
MRRGGLTRRLLLRTPSFAICLAPPVHAGASILTAMMDRRRRSCRWLGVGEGEGGLTKLQMEWEVGQHRDVFGGGIDACHCPPISTLLETFLMELGHPRISQAWQVPRYPPVDSLVLRFWEDLPDSLQVIVHPSGVLPRLSLSRPVNSGCKARPCAVG